MIEYPKFNAVKYSKDLFLDLRATLLSKHSLNILHSFTYDSLNILHTLNILHILHTYAKYVKYVY